MNKTLYATALAVALTGCSMMPEYQRPAVPVAAVWPDSANPTGARRVSDTDWRSYYSDPRLQALISAALENNRDLRIATARIAEARGQYGIQQAERIPNVNLNAGHNASRNPLGGSSSGTNGTYTHRYDVSVGLVSFELDFWGRVASLNEAAKANYLATEAAQRAFRLSLVADVANAYLSLLELRERAQLAAMTAAARATTRELTSRRRDLGVSSDLDFLQADGAYQGALAERANLERQQAAAENLLDVLVGQPVAQMKDLPAARSLAEQGIASDLIAGLPAEVLLQRPDVLAAEQKLIAANANIGAVRASFLPRITLTGNFGTASRTLSGLFASDSEAWSFQPTLVQSLFDTGRYSSNLDVAEARKIIAVAEYEKVIQQAFREVANLLNAREKLAGQLAAQQANAEAQSQRLKLVEARYRAGIANHLELLDAQRESFAAQQGVIQVRSLALSSAAQLYKALAGQGAQ